MWFRVCSEAFKRGQSRGLPSSRPRAPRLPSGTFPRPYGLRRLARPHRHVHVAVDGAPWVWLKPAAGPSPAGPHKVEITVVHANHQPLDRSVVVEFVIPGGKAHHGIMPDQLVWLRPPPRALAVGDASFVAEERKPLPAAMAVNVAPLCDFSRRSQK